MIRRYQIFIVVDLGGGRAAVRLAGGPPGVISEPCRVTNKLQFDINKTLLRQDFPLRPGVYTRPLYVQFRLFHKDTPDTGPELLA
ncbi:hypothetical protein EVAR_18848_1 [Eumeta japonica]|uniref:Uncharacterized protein n=1 Tax=Eumeta variegata TaxID=151549 RepID=A0A4C1ULQ4_EUMVA|nr:hypothetical protein EVAR_18848_1 [Eumeta japonica]